MKVRFWGTRGSIPTPGPHTTRYGGNTSCVEVRADGHIIIFDAGTGIRELGIHLLEEFGPQPLTFHLMISHTHWDHIQGIPFFLPLYQKHNTAYIYGPPGRDKSFAEVLRVQMDTEFFPVAIGDIRAKVHINEVREPIALEKITATSFYLNHPAMNLAYRVSDGNRSVVYATDNEPYLYTLHQSQDKPAGESDYAQYLDMKFVEFLSDADLYIGEAQYTSEEYKTKKGWGHSPIESTVEFAWRAGVKRLAIFHHDPLHSDGMIDQMVEHARSLLATQDSRIECFGAREGMELTL